MSDANIYLTPEVYRLVNDDATRQGVPASDLITQIVGRHYRGATWYSDSNEADPGDADSLASDLMAHLKALQTENANLRGDLSTTTAEIGRLRRQNRQLIANPDETAYEAGVSDGYNVAVAGRDYWMARAETWQAEAVRRGDIIERVRDAIPEVDHA